MTHFAHTNAYTHVCQQATHSHTHIYIYIYIGIYIYIYICREGGLQVELSPAVLEILQAAASTPGGEV